jgi:hypothetical protein
MNWIDKLCCLLLAILCFIWLHFDDCKDELGAQEDWNDERTEN